MKVLIRIRAPTKVGILKFTSIVTTTRVKYGGYYYFFKNRWTSFSHIIQYLAPMLFFTSYRSNNKFAVIKIRTTQNENFVSSFRRYSTKRRVHKSNSSVWKSSLTFSHHWNRVLSTLKLQFQKRMWRDVATNFRKLQSQTTTGFHFVITVFN